MANKMADGIVDVGKNEVHCSVCGALQGSFGGGTEGEMHCVRCGRLLRFSVQDEEIILSCVRKKK